MSDYPRNTTSHALTPANTNEAAVYAAASGSRGAFVLAAFIANVSGGSANATLRWFDGTTNWALVNAKAIATATYEVIDLHNLKIPAGGSVKFTSSVASALTVTVIVEELTR